MFEVIAGGCTTIHHLPYRMSRPFGLPHYVILIIRTHGIFCIRQECYDIAPGHALIIEPNTSYAYDNPDGDYIDDWLHFRLTEDVTLDNALTAVSLPTNKPFPIANTDLFTTIFGQILWEHSYGHPRFAAENIDHMFQIILNNLQGALLCMEESSNTQNRFLHQFRQIRLDLQNTLHSPHCIREYADQLGVSESYFQRLYTHFFSVPFQQDLIQLRIDHAKYIITTTDLTMEQVSEACGYNSTVHFYRQFRKLTGITPNAYRKKMLHL